MSLNGRENPGSPQVQLRVIIFDDKLNRLASLRDETGGDARSASK
jgi:hypothetical protein